MDLVQMVIERSLRSHTPSPHWLLFGGIVDGLMYGVADGVMVDFG
jgi:hypothetical protein